MLPGSQSLVNVNSVRQGLALWVTPADPFISRRAGESRAEYSTLTGTRSQGTKGLRAQKPARGAGAADQPQHASPRPSPSGPPPADRQSQGSCRGTASLRAAQSRSSRVAGGSGPCSHCLGLGNCICRDCLKAESSRGGVGGFSWNKLKALGFKGSRDPKRSRGAHCRWSHSEQRLHPQTNTKPFRLPRCLPKLTFPAVGAVIPRRPHRRRGQVEAGVP